MISERKIDIEDMSKMAKENPEAFTLARRNGFGASDSSIILGVNHWQKLEDLLVQKQSKVITEEELAVGKKPQVRMGNDCEPIILDKFCEWSGFDISKPTAQYRLVDYPFLTVNYDGLGQKPHELVVEAKTVSQYARKYWKWENAMKDVTDYRRNVLSSSSNIKTIIEEQAEMIGIPPYYYTQIQQQLIGVQSEHAYLAALDVKEWELRVFKVYQDERIQEALVMKAAACAEQLGWDIS